MTSLTFLMCSKFLQAILLWSAEHIRSTSKKKTSVQVDVSERRAHSEAHQKTCRYTFWSARRSSDVRRTLGGRWLVERSARSEQATSALVDVLEHVAQIEFDRN